jgi:hypothetical protein
VCALASLASAVPLIRLRYEQPRHTRPVSGSGARRVSEGLRALGADTGLRLIAPLGFVQTFLRGCATVLVVVVAIDLLGGGDADIGVLNAAIGLGALVASLLASTITLEWPSRPLPRRRRRPLRRAPITHRRRSARGGRRAAAGRHDRRRQALVDGGAYTLPARLEPGAVRARTFATLEALWTLGVAFGAAVTSP